MSVDEAIKLLELKYKRAKALEYVRNPLVWALYHGWKKADADERNNPEPPKEGE